MRIMAWAAAVFFFLIFKSAFSPSRPPPDPLERRPSPLPISELSTGRDGSQVPKTAALMVLSIIAASVLLVSCGGTPVPTAEPTPTPWVPRTVVSVLRAEATARVEATQAADKVAQAAVESAQTAVAMAPPEPDPRPVPDHVSAGLKRHHQTLLGLIGLMQDLLLKGRRYKPLEVPHLAREMNFCSKAEKEIRERGAYSDGCVLREDYTEKVRAHAAAKDAYIADNKYLVAEWVRHVNLLCKWTMEHRNIRFLEEAEQIKQGDLLNACVEPSPWFDYYRHPSPSQATTFTPHYGRIVEFFRLQEIARSW